MWGRAGVTAVTAVHAEGKDTSFVGEPLTLRQTFPDDELTDSVVNSNVPKP